MSGQFSTYNIAQRADEDTNSLVVNSDPLNDEVLEDAALIHETPMSGTDAAIGPVNEPLADEIPMYETPIQQEIQMGAFAVESPMDETIVHGESTTHKTPIATNAGPSAALLNREESEHFRMRWNEIQGMFVDEPRTAVQQADVLVSEVIEQITQMFANEHSSLEGQWNQGNDASTEDLRMALQHYRSFFNRMVV